MLDEFYKQPEGAPIIISRVMLYRLFVYWVFYDFGTKRSFGLEQECEKYCI